MTKGSSSNTDFTDYWLQFFHSSRLEDFTKAWEQLVNEATLYVKEKSKDEPEYQEVSFEDAINEEYIQKDICFRALVVGEALRPYRYPTRVRLTCNFSKGDSCKSCGLFVAGGKMEAEVKLHPLELININEYHKNLLIRQQLGIVSCGHFRIKALEEQNLQELYLTPLLEEEQMEQRFITRHSFCIGNDITPNKVYKFYGRSINNPADQTVVFFFTEAVEEQSSLETFTLSENEKEQLKIFQVEQESTIEKKLTEIYNDFSLNLEPILRHRNDLMLACDLVYHSVLQFYFADSLQRGWGECLLIGDTSTGKTKSSEKLLRHYKLGIVQGVGGATIAGLIGGMTKMEGSHIMSWGLIPLNNSKLVMFDEMSDIDKEVIGQLTRIRGEGVASRTIAGGTRQTTSKVRLIWLSNPRRDMTTYDTGCDMVKDLIGKSEDISRFDFIVTASSDEVQAWQMNQRYPRKPKHRFTSELCNKLVLWAWSRKPNNVIFDQEVEEKILAYSIEMADKYSAAFPLVLGSTIRLKLAKLAVSLACRLFSTKDGENVFVTIKHVDFVKGWLEEMYRKPSFNYEDYSLFHRTNEKEVSSSKDIVRSVINKNCGDKAESFMLNMMNTKRITALEIQDFAQCGKMSADQLRTSLVSNQFLERKQGFYVKSPLFKKFLTQELKGEEE